MKPILNKNIRICFLLAVISFGLQGISFAQMPSVGGNQSNKEELKLEMAPASTEGEKGEGEKASISGTAAPEKERLSPKVVEKPAEKPVMPEAAEIKPPEAAPAAVAVKEEPPAKPEPKKAGRDIVSQLYESVANTVLNKLKGKKAEAIEKKEEARKKRTQIRAEGTPVKGPILGFPPFDVVNGEFISEGLEAGVKESLSIGTFGGSEHIIREKKKEHFARESGLSVMSGSAGEEGRVFTLKECIDIAVQNHLPLQIAKKSLKLAEMRITEARRNMLPSVTIDYEDYHGRVNDKAYVGRKQYIEGQQPLFHGGELYYTLKQAEANRNITRNDYNRIRNDLVLQVKKGYYTQAKAKENLKFQEELSGEVNKINDMVNKQVEANIISKIEALNVASQASQARYQFASAKGDLSVAELILKQAMNIDTKQKVNVKPLPEFKKVDVDFENTFNIAMLNRPEIRINTLMMDYYNYGRGVAKAKGYPKVDLLGQWGLAREQFVPGDMDVGIDVERKLSAQWYAGIKASMPFWGSTGEYSFTKEQWVPVVNTVHGTEATTLALKLKVLDKLDVYSDRQLAEIDYDKGRQEFTKVKQDITLEVRESCFNYEKACIQLDTASDKVKYQEKDLELVKMKRSMDEAQDSNVIESMIKLGQEKFGYLQALADCHISLGAINKAIGLEEYYKDE